jgi:hypothetical protein
MNLVRIFVEVIFESSSSLMEAKGELPLNFLSRIEKVLARPGAVCAIVVVSLAAAASSLHAQSLEPRAYGNTPVGMNFLLGSYTYIQGDVLLDPSAPVKDADSEIHSTVLAYARSIDVWGKSGKIRVLLPYAWLSGSGVIESTGERGRRDISGFADPAVSFSVNLYGAPALSFEEFKDYRQDTIVGVSLLVFAPLGQYDPDRLANIGTNRWLFKPEVGVSKELGRLTLETALAVTFFTENDDFFGGNTREQDPLYAVQVHAIYTLPSGIWAALNATYFTGGRTKVNGVEGDDRQENWRFGLTLALPVDRHNSIKLFTSSGVLTRTGSDFDLIGFAWQYRWGGGF